MCGCRLNNMFNVRYKRYLFLTILCVAIMLRVFSFPSATSRSEILVRLPLIFDKNVLVIRDALDSVSGIEKVEVCYSLKVMIITYNPDIDETSIMAIINNQRINTTVEKIFAIDIPVIRRNYVLENIRLTVKPEVMKNTDLPVK